MFAIQRKKPVVALRLADVIGNCRAVPLTKHIMKNLTRSAFHSCGLQARLTTQEDSGRTGGEMRWIRLGGFGLCCWMSSSMSAKVWYLDRL